MAVREFDGVDDKIVTATGALSSMTRGTVIFIAKFDTINRFNSVFYLHNSGGSFVGIGIGIEDVNNQVFWFDGSDLSRAVAVSTGTWYLVVIRKAIGTATPRISLYNYTTQAWTHSAGNVTCVDGTAPGSSGDVGMSFQHGNNAALDGRLAARAAWANILPWSADAAGDTALEASRPQTGAHIWRDALASALWLFNQASTSTAVEDLSTTGTADQTSITGTTVATGDDPPGFDFTHESQTLLPTSTQAAGSWTPATNPHLSIDEGSNGGSSLGDGNVATSDAVGNNTNTSNLDVKLATGTDPAVSIGHILRIRWNQSGASLQAHIELWEGNPASGGTKRAEIISATDVGATEVLATYTLTGTEADSITDYSNLYLRFWGRGTAGGPARSMIVELAEFRIPPAAGGTPVSGSDAGTSSDAGVLIAADTTADAGTGSDAVTARTAELADTGTGVEAITVLYEAAGDVGVGSDTASVQEGELPDKTGSDIGAGADDVTALAIQLVDTGTGADNAMVPEAGDKTGTDSGDGTDTVTAHALVAVDGGSSTETANVPEAGDKSAVDSGDGVDMVTSRALIAIDAGTGADTTGLARTTTDAGTGADTGSSATVGEDKTGTDQGAGSENIPSRDVTTAELAIAADTIAARLLTAVDAGIGTDSAPSFAFFGIATPGVATVPTAVDGAATVPTATAGTARVPTAVGG